MRRGVGLYARFFNPSFQYESYILKQKYFDLLEPSSPLYSDLRM